MNAEKPRSKVMPLSMLCGCLSRAAVERRVLMARAANNAVNGTKRLKLSTSLNVKVWSGALQVQATIEIHGIHKQPA